LDGLVRMFVALVPPDDVVEHLDTFLDVRREAAAFRWTPADQVHVTLAFLEDVPDWQLDDLEERLAAAAARRTPFAVSVAGGGAFPDVARAKVLYAGLDLAPDARTELDRLAAGCRAAASTAGLEVDGRRFRPHLTVARCGRPTEVTRWVRLLDGYRGPGWAASGVSLVASYLGEGPRGRARHEVVSTFRFR
jgi:2'-5' RNA ligase